MKNTAETFQEPIELVGAEDVLSKEDREKAQDSLFRRFRKGILNMIGRLGAIMVIISVPNVMKGTEVNQGQKPLKSKEVQKMSVSKQEINNLQKSGATSFSEFVLSSSPQELEVLKMVEPDNVTVIDSQGNEPGKVVLDYTGGESKNLEKKEVFAGDVDSLQIKGNFLWGEKDFSKAELQEMETALIKKNIENALDLEFEAYQDWNIDLNTAIDKVVINGVAFSSPEGELFSKEANLKLSAQRAGLVEKIVKDLLLKKYNLSVNKIEISVTGQGAQGDVLDFAHSLENLGYHFKNKADNDQKRGEVEKLIRLMNLGQADEVLKKINSGSANIGLQDLNKFFVQDIGSKRSFDLDINIFDKDIEIQTAKIKKVEEVPVKKTPKTPATSFLSQERSQVVSGFVQEFATRKINETVRGYFITPPQEVLDGIKAKEEQNVSEYHPSVKDFEQGHLADLNLSLRQDLNEKLYQAPHYKGLIREWESNRLEKVRQIMASGDSGKINKELKELQAEKIIDQVPIYKNLEKRQRQDIVKNIDSQVMVTGAMRIISNKNIPRDVAQRRAGVNFKKQPKSSKRIKR